MKPLPLCISDPWKSPWSGGGGSFVGPEGTVFGGGGGAVIGGAVGAVAGPIVGAVGGAGIGAYIGYKICSGGETVCDTMPRAVPIPFPTGEPIPLFPPLGPNNPPRDRDKEDQCFKRCEHLLGLPFDFGNSFRKCYRECRGTL